MEIICLRMSHTLTIHQADSVSVHHVLVPFSLIVHLNVKKKDLQNILGCISCADTDSMSAFFFLHK